MNSEFIKNKSFEYKSDKNYHNFVQEPAVVDDHGPVPPHGDTCDFVRPFKPFVVDIVSVRLATLVVVDEGFVQAGFCGNLSKRVDQLHPHGGVGAGAFPVTGGDLCCESGHGKKAAHPVVDGAQHLYEQVVSLVRRKLKPHCPASYAQSPVERNTPGASLEDGGTRLRTLVFAFGAGRMEVAS